MMLPLLLMSTAIAAQPDAAQPDALQPNAEQVKLLKVFREEFIAVTPGDGDFPREFTMGDDAGPVAERPAHTVRMGHSFAIARYEVPQNLWEAVMGDNPSKWKGKRNSVEMLSFDDACEFCGKATELMRAAKLIGADEKIRLPCEAEWEYSARAGTATRYSFGDEESMLGEYAWFNGNAKGNDPPVGAKKPNAWQLFDVHGYLWEWCSDRWHDDYVGAPADGADWNEGGDADRRVLRGGSWKDGPRQLASSFRRPGQRELTDDAVGLRCVLAAE
jgi:formylglycine-generating enzyme required for sulfatase activity